jgi:cyclopropane fatty-acyl-phospholipid synthase-like methyltransferase
METTNANGAARRSSDVPATRARQVAVTATARKLKWTTVAGGVAKRALNPKQVVTAVKLQMKRKAHRHVYDDAQLALYAKVLPTEFLHFGFFDKPDLKPEDTALSDVVRAQNRYAELVLEQAGDPAHPVLDIGCGMGGLCRMLLAKNYTPTALTPDRLQVAHVQATLPGIKVIRGKLEDLKTAGMEHTFGTLITAESLQYLKLAKALPVLSTLIRPGGRWVACDFFHSHPSEDRACHVWDDFVSKLTESGWKLAYQRDITPHVLPTLAYIHMWATRFGIPLMDFAFLRLRRKQPALHHMLAGALEQLTDLAQKNIDVIDPHQFAAGKKYMLLAMERA